MDTKIIKRNNYLDWLRVLAIFVVFFYHSTRFFNLEDWEVKNAMRYDWVELWNIFAWNWMMPLMFVISGASLFYAVGKGSTRKFFKDKALRLLVPFFFALFTHVTFQVYLRWITHGLFSGSYFLFYPEYLRRTFSEYGLWGIFELEQMHVWYLLWLFILTLLAYPLMLWLKRGGRRALSAVSSFLSLPGTVYLLALPIVLLLVLPDPESPVMAEKGGGWSQVIYLWFLISGFLILSSEGVQANIKRLRWISLGIGIVLIAILLYTVVTQGVPAFGTSDYTVVFGLAGFSSWCWILAFFGLGMAYLDFRTPKLDYANEAVLPFYLLHQSVLICVGYYIIQLPIPDLLKWLLILVVCFAVIMGIYEYMVRRFNLMRFLFGMKTIAKPAAESTQPAAHPAG
jgi:peptidoglycan/LPS O-acetylase OafA/YrhL